MNFYEGLITYTVLWWLFLFMALPFGAKPEEHPLPGNAASAPARPRLLLKFAIVTVLAAIATAAVYGVIQSGLIDLRPPPEG
jgi:predicted secreted protein